MVTLITCAMGFLIGYICHIFISANQLIIEWRKVREAWRRLKRVKIAAKGRVILSGYSSRAGYTTIISQVDTPF